MTVSAIELRQPPIRRQSLWRYWRGGLQGSEFTWAVAFVVPYIAVFLGFVIYPAFYGLWMVFGVDGPSWLNSRWFALGSAVFSHVWKWTPFWTVILLAGRMSIPQEIYDAAKVDGATGLKRFLYVTFPLLANLYLVLTLLATIFLLGDFNSVYFV